MLVGSRQKLKFIQNNKLNITVKDTVIEDICCEKILGVRIDNELSWNEQVDYVCKIVSSRLALLRRIKPFIDTNTCILYYNGYRLFYR